MSAPKPIDFASVVDFAAMRDWTDEQWAEHDARVVADRAQAQPPVILGRPRLVEDLDWPAGRVRVAEHADRARPALARLLAHDFTARSVVVLSGPAGCGKTVAAAAWALSSGLRVRFVRAATFAASSRYDAAQREQWFGAPAIVLDDLGAEYLDAKGSFLVDLDELVDTFYGDERPLVITTNATAPEFKTRYGARIERRVRECGRFYPIGGAS